MESIIIELPSWPNHRRFEYSPGEICRIGRAANNEIILNDMTVDPQRLTLQHGEQGWMLSVTAGLNPVTLNGREISGDVVLSDNADVQIGATRFKIWLNTPALAPTVPLRASGMWRVLCHPLIACMLMLAAWGSVLMLDFLQTQQTYKFNGRLLCENVLMMILLLWFVGHWLYRISRRYLICASLSAISLISLCSDFTIEFLRIVEFQLSTDLSWLALLCTLAFIYWIWNSLLKNFMRFQGKTLAVYTCLLSSAFFILFTYNYLNKNNFFYERDGMTPAFPQTLLPQKIGGVHHDLQSFLNIQTEGH